MDKVLRINELTPGWNTQTNRWHAASRLQYFQKHVNLDLPIQFLIEQINKKYYLIQNTPTV